MGMVVMKNRNRDINFDMTTEYSEEFGRCTISDLCSFLEKKDKENDVDNNRSYTEYISKFKDYRKTGLLDKLIELEHFDVEKIAGEDRKEIFDMLKLLKVLYDVEKDGTTRRVLGEGKELSKVRITDILAHPSMENINTYYTSKNVYGDVFDELEKKIAIGVNDSKSIIEIFNEINYQWDCLINSLFEYVYSERAFWEPQIAYSELERIHIFFEEKILKNLNIVKPEEVSEGDGVLATFFNILQSHRCMCMDADRQIMEFSILDGEEISEQFLDVARKFKDLLVPWKNIEEIKTAFKEGNVNDDSVVDIIDFITCYKPLNAEDIKHYRYALSKVKKITEWMSEYREADYSKGVGLIDLTAIVQEIVNDKKSNRMVNNMYYGYHYKSKSILTLIKKMDEADAVVHETMLTRLENRSAVYLGERELIEKKRQIERTVYKIKEYIFRHRRLDDMVFVDDILFHFASRNTVSSEYAKRIENDFMELIAEKLVAEIKTLQFLPVVNENVKNLFKELGHGKPECMNEVATRIADKINSFYGAEASDILSCGEKYPIEIRDGCNIDITYGNGRARKFVFWFRTIKFDKNKGVVQWLGFNEIMDKENFDRMRRLGLKKFMSTSPVE